MESHDYLVCPNEYASKALAEAETQFPAVPALVSEHTVYAARIIFKSNDSSDITIQLPAEAVGSATPISVHNSLSGIQGGAANDWWHLIWADYNNVVSQIWNINISILFQANTTTNQRIDSLNSTMQTINTTTNGRIDSLNSTMQTINTTTNSRIDSLVTANTTTNGRIDSLNSTMQTINTTTNSRIDSLVTANTTTNGRIDSLNSTIQGVQSNVSDLQSANITTNSRIDSLNSTKVTIGSNANITLNWTYLDQYPIACPANSWMTTIGDTTTCTALGLTVVNDSNINGYFTNQQLTLVWNGTLPDSRIANASSFLRSVPYQSNASGWTNTSTLISTAMNVNITGNLTVANINSTANIRMLGVKWYVGKWETNGNFSGQCYNGTNIWQGSSFNATAVGCSQ
jgi:prefoldin subunit 5